MLVILSIAGWYFRYGFVESEFNLSPESRLPKWVDVPSGYTRTDLSMTIRFYTFGYAKMCVRGPAPKYKVIKEIMGKDRFHPMTKEQAWDEYPRHTMISVNGVEEVFEKRQDGNILYITDDPKVTAVLKKK
jgi:hypothetical protein